jgi:hypothetical protein
MKTLRGFNKIQAGNKIFGLDFLDLLILLFIYLVVFVLSANLVANLGLVGGAYFVLKLYKKGKAPHWTGSVLRFLLAPRNYPVRRERKEEMFQ